LRYYHCTNCGGHEDFGFDRKRNVHCSHCGYEDILEFDAEEYEEELVLKGKIVVDSTEESDIISI